MAFGRQLLQACAKFAQHLEIRTTPSGCAKFAQHLPISHQPMRGAKSPLFCRLHTRSFLLDIFVDDGDGGGVAIEGFDVENFGFPDAHFQSPYSNFQNE